MIQVQIFSHPLGMDDDENLLLLILINNKKNKIIEIRKSTHTSSLSYL